MTRRLYRWGELIGIVCLLGATAMQIFYLDPLKRQIEWRLSAFSMQQSAQLQLQATFENQIALLKLMKAPAEEVQATEARRGKVLDRFKTADANIADYLLEKERVEDTLQIFVLVVFAFGSLLAGVSKALEMRYVENRG